MKSSKIIITGVILSLLATTIIIVTATRLGFFKKSSPITNQIISQKPDEDEELMSIITPQPEIPTNEYWDFARLPNRHIYINNTDRNVVYILDDNGKIVGTVWGKNYKLEYFEPQLIQKANTRPLLVLKKNADHISRIVIIDPIAGNVLWHTTFDGYFDGPQMQILRDGTWIMENYGGSTQGVHVRAVNPETGAIKWEIKKPDYYGMYWNNYQMPPGQFSTNSGGVGRGNWKFHYIIQTESNTSTPAGTILSRDTYINKDIETSAPLTVVWFPDDKRITLFDREMNAQWSVKPGDKLYDIITSRPHGATELFVYPANIIAQYYEDRALSPEWDVFSTQNSNFLWHKDFSGSGYSIYTAGELNGVLVTIQTKISDCGNICKNETCSGWICIERPVAIECTQCRAQEQNKPDYIGVSYQAFEGATGKLLWTRGAKFIFLRKFNSEENKIEIEENGKLIFLNPKTGDVLAEELLPQTDNSQ